MKRIVPFAAVLLLRCDGFHQAPCNPGVCHGCCDSSGSCQAGTADTACGTDGGACADCTKTSLTCNSNACVLPARQDAGPEDGGTEPDAGQTLDAGTPTDSGSSADSGSVDSGIFVSLAPCTDAGMYVSATSIQFGVTANTYRPNCVTVSAGATVTWSGSFTVHPLRPSTRGTRPSPIHFVDAGTDAGFAFPNEGFYPFYCLVHGTDGGTGMAGVIQVIP